MVFTEEQKSFYIETGYFAVPDFFTQREVAAMRAELERFKQEGKLRNVTTEGDGKTHSSQSLNLQLIPLYNISDLYRAMGFHEKLVAAVTELIGEPAILHLDQIFLKPGKHGRGTDWHQDNQYFNVSDPTKGIGTWTALHDATVANGTMHVIPATYHDRLEHTRDPFSDHHMRCQPDESRSIPIEIPAGGVLFFCYGVPHCTKANTTAKERAGLALHFLRADYAPEDLVKPGRTERPLVSGPGCTGGEREYGVRVAGTWENEVEKVLAAAGINA